MSSTSIALDGKKPYATAPKASRNQWLSVNPATQIGEARFGAKLNASVFDWMTIDAQRFPPDPNNNNQPTLTLPADCKAVLLTQ